MMTLTEHTSYFLLVKSFLLLDSAVHFVEMSLEYLCENPVNSVLLLAAAGMVAEYYNSNQATCNNDITHKESEFLSLDSQSDSEGYSEMSISDELSEVKVLSDELLPENTNESPNSLLDSQDDKNSSYLQLPFSVYKTVSGLLFQKPKQNTVAVKASSCEVIPAYKRF